MKAVLAGALVLIAVLVDCLAAQDLPRVVAIGDSMTYGADVGPAERWPVVLAGMTGYHVQDYANNGVAAREFSQIAEQVFKIFLTGMFVEKTTVVIMLGTNDWGLGSSLEQFTEDYKRIVSTVLAGVDVVCITPPVRCGESNGVVKPGGKLEGFRQVIRDQCRGVVVEGPAIVPRSRKNFAGCIHPSAHGHSLIAAAVRKALK